MPRLASKVNVSCRGDPPSPAGPRLSAGVALSASVPGLRKMHSQDQGWSRLIFSVREYRTMQQVPGDNQKSHCSRQTRTEWRNDRSPESESRINVNLQDCV